MANFKIYRETTLPATPVNDSLYVVVPSGSLNYFELYAVNSSGVIRRIPTEADIDAKISTALSSFSSLEVVNTIAERDTLTPTSNTQVLVKNATGDATVTSGAATYIYETSTSTWTKISESESLDVILNWANIVGKPTSTPAQIDSAVTNTHTHTNKTQLDLLGQNVGGELTYNGVQVKTEWSSTGW
jgi:hypothetical protein